MDPGHSGSIFSIGCLGNATELEEVAGPGVV